MTVILNEVKNPRIRSRATFVAVDPSLRSDDNALMPMNLPAPHRNPPRNARPFAPAGPEERKLASWGREHFRPALGRHLRRQASGSNLGTLSEAGTAECRFDKLLPLLDCKAMTDAAIDEALFAARWTRTPRSRPSRPSPRLFAHLRA